MVTLLHHDHMSVGLSEFNLTKLSEDCAALWAQTWKNICAHGTVITWSLDSVSVKYRTSATRRKVDQEVLEVMKKIQWNLQLNILS